MFSREGSYHNLAELILISVWKFETRNAREGGIVTPDPLELADILTNREVETEIAGVETLTEKLFALDVHA